MRNSVPVALVTGATSGLGFEMVHRLCDDGYLVLATGRRDAPLKEHAARFGEKVRCFRADLASSEDVTALIQWVEGQAPEGIDLYIHSAGVAHLGAVAHMPTTAYTDSFAVHVTSLAQVVRAQIKHWGAGKKGTLVSVSSGVAYRGLPEVSPYCSTKAAQLSLLESLAVELRPHGATVMSFSPGLMQSEFSNRAVHHGPMLIDFTEGRRVDLQTTSKRLLKAIKRRRANVEYSFVARAVRVLNAISPALISLLLWRKLRRSV